MALIGGPLKIGGPMLQPSQCSGKSSPGVMDWINRTVAECSRMVRDRQQWRKIAGT